MEPPDAHVLTLHDGEHLDSALFRLRQGERLLFAPGPSLLGRRVALYCNHVPNAGDEFVRAQYRLLDWADGRPLAHSEARASLTLTRAGAFHYYYTCDNELRPAGSGWFHVAPELLVPLDAICCQTVLPKCLGPLPRWESVLRVAHEAGYNMLHFTPVQRLGGSDSSYSIADQLRLDPRYGDVTFADLEALLEKMRREWRMLSVCDVVLNHTANETPWLSEHPEATYNCDNCPYLRPAALLDALLARVSDEVSRGEHAARGVPAQLDREEHLGALRALLADVAPALRLHELLQCDVDALVDEYVRMARGRVAPPAAEEGALRLLADPLRRRRAARVDLERALQLFHAAGEGGEEARVRAGAEGLRRALLALNEEARAEMDAHLGAAIDNVIAGVRYFRVSGDGPRLGAVSPAAPLTPRYFTWPSGALAAAEAAVRGPSGRLVQAHNGWVMRADPLKDFAADGAVYLRRELIAWGDSVKLRYGQRPDDCPFLWAHMREYVELTAELFDGLRLDNCHSTPLHVAEYLLDCARNVKPNLFVAAELFTDDDNVDNIFVNRLGITSLIREAMSAWDAHELGRLVHRYGGKPVGALSGLTPPAARPLRPAVAHALFLDLTHDNPSPARRRTPLDLLPNAALVSMAHCAVGSTRGYDELLPDNVHVVDETRLYRAWAAAPADDSAVGPAAGILAARRALNALHQRLAADGYEEVYVDQMDEHTVAVTRHDPRSRQSVVLVAATAFSEQSVLGRPPPPPLRLQGRALEVLLEAELRRHDEPPGKQSARFLTGLTGYELALRQSLPLARSAFIGAERPEPGGTVLELRSLPPGSVLCLRVAPLEDAAVALRQLQQQLDAPVALPLAELTLSDLNVALYRSEAEERDAGGGPYEVPGHGPLVYAGMQGVTSLLAEVVPADDVGHPLCANLRAGDWLAEYLWRRLEPQSRLRPLAAAYRDALRPLSALPRFLVPAYFAALVLRWHRELAEAALGLMSEFVRSGCGLTRALALTSVQLVGAVPSATLPRSAPYADTLSAGLPHFATGYMRCWGRDTFISVRGLLLLTGRHEDARRHLLGYAACLRHGLIPNLLDGGERARFNCRDAVWWWAYALQQYCELAPEGTAVLDAPVSRLFPRDDSPPAAPGHDQPLRDVLQEALDAHFQGRAFRERNAGRQLDAHMSDRGFDVQIGIDPETGFPFGGNDANCGTWMDKMGSSERAGTRGKPATPRDGSAVELVALAYSTAVWLARLHAGGRYPHAGLARAHRDGAATAWTWRQWAERVRRHFERRFWVDAAADPRPDLVHRTHIYRDTVGASQPWADYQLRCNYVVAMAVAPELFDAKHAWEALDAVERHLLGPLGLKTLDPDDWNYCGDYDNSNDSTDAKVAHGFNYHQGPEWVWPLGFYLRARLLFAVDNGRYAHTVGRVRAALGPLLREVRSSPWRALPELTNSRGSECAGSCRSQAWSGATALEVLYELRAMETARPLPAD